MCANGAQRCLTSSGLKRKQNRSDVFLREFLDRRGAGAATPDGSPSRCGLKAVAFVCMGIMWVLVDLYTKSLFADVKVGQLVAGPFAGIFDIRLVHNRGAAWGMLADSTFALGVFSAVMCGAAFVYFLFTVKRASWLETIGLALVVGGGVGNAIDRFVQGYVVDFIEATFIDFPVFNVADIGVTCGIVLFMLGVLMSGAHIEDSAAEKAE